MPTAKVAKVPTRKVGPLVRDRIPFNNSSGSLWGTTMNGMYVVFSYRTSWPLFVYEPKTERWYANEDKYSVTSSNHFSCAHPHCETYPLSVTALRELINGGYNWLVKQRLYGAV